MLEVATMIIQWRKKNEVLSQTAVDQLGHNYSWLIRRVHEYRMGTLKVEE